MTYVELTCIGRKIDQRTIADFKARLSCGISLVSFRSGTSAVYIWRQEVVRESSPFPFLCALANGMSGPSGSNTAEKVAAASAATLTLPQHEKTEKGIRTEPVDDPTQDQSSAEKEKAREDEEWLENPAHPRNWSSTKKWTNMAIVSRFPPRP